MVVRRGTRRAGPGVSRHARGAYRGGGGAGRSGRHPGGAAIRSEGCRRVDRWVSRSRFRVIAGVLRRVTFTRVQNSFKSVRAFQSIYNVVGISSRTWEVRAPWSARTRSRRLPSRSSGFRPGTW